MDTWEMMPPLQTSRSAAAFAVLDDQIFIIGGATENNTSETSKNERYDGQTWTEVRNDYNIHSSFICSIHMFIWLKSILCYLFSIHILHFIYNKVAGINEPHDHPSACVKNDRIYVAGGFGADSKEVTDVQVYDAQRDEWVKTTSLAGMFAGGILFVVDQ